MQRDKMWRDLISKKAANIKWWQLLLGNLSLWIVVHLSINLPIIVTIKGALSSFGEEILT